jgi:hypothetical protein
MTRTRALSRFVAIVSAAAQLAPVAAVASPPASSAAANAAPAWKQIYETNQTIYYVGAASPARTGETDVATLLEFKVPQVVDGAQVWSMLSRMQLNCASEQVMTLENTFYAGQMATGTAVQTQAASDAWHAPDPGSLGELVWNTGCGRS